MKKKPNHIVYTSISHVLWLALIFIWRPFRWKMVLDRLLQHYWCETRHCTWTAFSFWWVENNSTLVFLNVLYYNQCNGSANKNMPIIAKIKFTGAIWGYWGGLYNPHNNLTHYLLHRLPQAIQSKVRRKWKNYNHYYLHFKFSDSDDDAPVSQWLSFKEALANGRNSSNILTLNNRVWWPSSDGSTSKEWPCIY